MSHLNSNFGAPILLNVTDIQRAEIKQILGDAYQKTITSKRFGDGYDPMDIFEWDHLTISFYEDEGFKLTTAKNVVFLSEKYGLGMDAFTPVEFEVFKFICFMISKNFKEEEIV